MTRDSIRTRPRISAPRMSPVALGIARDRFGGRGNRLALAERAERGGNPQREAGGDHRPLDDLDARRAGARLLRVKRKRDARHHHERRCPESPFAHNQFLLK